MTADEKFEKFWDDLESVSALLKKLGYEKESITVDKAIFGMVASTTKIRGFNDGKDRKTNRSRRAKP